MKKIGKIILFILTICIFFSATGCNVPKAEKVNVSDIKVAADTAAEKIFTGISEEDYAKFSEDFDAQMKSALAETKFKEIVGQLGTYESKEIIGADKMQGYTRAYYKTKFSKFSRDLTFTVVFSTAGDYKVSGLFYK